MKHVINKVTDIIHDQVKSSQDILKLLYYDESDVDIYAQGDLPLELVSQIVKDRLLTRKKEFSNEKQCCYMVMRYGRKVYHHSKNKVFNGNTFNFYVLCHNDIIINDFYGDRVGEIEGVLETLFDDVELEGVACRCKVSFSEDIESRTGDYSGRHIQIEFIDANGLGL